MAKISFNPPSRNSASARFSLRWSFKKLRLWLAYPLFIVYPLVARVTDFSFWTGIGFMFLGLAIRFWASGYIQKSRTLAVNGPYAYTRNPLYLGNFILGLGIVFISGNLWFILYYFISFLVLYRGTIAEEQAVLDEKFGAAYRDYLRCVPMFFPLFIKGYKGSRPQAFSLRQSFDNGEFIRLCGFMVLMLCFYLWRGLMLKKEGLALSNLAAIGLFAVFLVLLWLSILTRRRSQASALPNSS